MKKWILSAILSSLSIQAGAQSSQDLKDLVPPGHERVVLAGRAQDNQLCEVALSVYAGNFGAVFAVLDRQGNMDSRRFGSFKIGFGHELQKVERQGNSLIAVSVHKANDQYSSDARTTLKVNKSGDQIKAIQLIEEEKGWFGFKTKLKETCIFN